MKTSKILALVLAVAMVLSMMSMVAFADVVTYYVSTDGNDANAGTEDAPFANIQKAVNVAKDGDTVIVKAGNYNVYCPTTDANNYTGRNHNLFIGKSITVKGEGEVNVYSYQEAYTSTFDARITILVSGSDGLVIDNLNIYPCYYPEAVSTNLSTVSGSEINTIVGANTLKFYYNQIIDAMRSYNGSGQVSKTYIANITVKNCTIGDEAIAREEWGSAIYYPGYVGNATNNAGLNGGYTIEGNTLYGSICICEGAAEQAESEDCVIRDNILYDAVILNGKRPTGWNYKSLTVFPEITNNTFKGYIEAGSLPKSWFISSRDGDEGALVPVATMNEYVSSNTFDADGMIAKVSYGSYPYSETSTEYYAIVEAVHAVAKIGDVYYESLQDAVNAVPENGTVVLLDDIEEGTIKLPATLKNVTITGTPEVSTFALAGAPVIKNTTIMSADGNSVVYDGLTIDGIVFDNSNIVLTGWRIGDVLYKNIKVTNCEFKNIVRTNNEAAVHVNVSETEGVQNFIFENNVINGVSGNQNSGIYIAADGEIVIRNNVISNVAFRPFVIQVIDNNGASDNLVVTGNEFSGSPKGRLQAYGMAGTDKVTIAVNNNILKDIDPNQAQQICFWNFDEDTTTADFSKNYYDINPLENLSRFYYNSAASSATDLDDFQVVPYYTALTADGKIDEASSFDGIAEGISVVYNKSVDDCTEDYLVYDIVLKANSTNDAAFINRLNSADLTFKLAKVNGDNMYEIIASNPEVAINPVNNSSDRYEFHYAGKSNTTTDIDDEIVIGQVKISGYGEFVFGVDEDATTNAAHATTIDDNIVDTYIPGGNIANGEGKLFVDADSISETIKVPTRKLTIKVTFPNNIVDNEASYQDMMVTINGGELEEAIEISLGGALADQTYTVEEYLTVNRTYVVTVSGEGYRTARYSVNLNDHKTLNFWNNVMDEEDYIEEGKGSKMVANYLAGDIVADNNINIFDLSAVVSYFGEVDLKTAKPEFVKYDLNRDGKIDSKDVALVLVSWNN